MSAVILPLEVPRTTRVTGSDGVEVVRVDARGHAVAPAQFAAGLVDFLAAP
ncbi:MAG: hypothetical protein JWR70_2665 [Modestobacter sp.]|nr:hypothetical protein [Modestobacter sp.]